MASLIGEPSVIGLIELPSPQLYTCQSTMADSSLSLDLEEECSPPQVQHQPRSKKTKSRPHKAHTSSKTSAPNKAELRRHQALERQFEKAQQQASVQGQALGSGDGAGPSRGSQTKSSSSGVALHAGSNLRRSKGVSLSLPDVSNPSVTDLSSGHRRLPEATFTPTAAGQAIQ